MGFHHNTAAITPRDPPLPHPQRECFLTCHNTKNLSNIITVHITDLTHFIQNILQTNMKRMPSFLLLTSSLYCAAALSNEIPSSSSTDHTPAYCHAGNTNTVTGDSISGVLDYYEDAGHPAYGARCWQFSCPSPDSASSSSSSSSSSSADTDGVLHLKWERFVLGEEPRPYRSPDPEAVALYLQFADAAEPFTRYSGAGPLVGEDEERAPLLFRETLALQNRTLLLHYSQTSLRRWPGFRVAWSCEAPPAAETPPAMDLLPSPHKEDCWNLETISGNSITRKGFAKGVHCWLLPVCEKRMGVRVHEASSEVVLHNWEGGDSEQIYRGSYSREHDWDVWSGVLTGRVLIQVRAGSLQSGEKGFDVSWECLEEDAEVAPYFPQCGNPMKLAGEGEFRVSENYVPEVLCHNVVCGNGVVIEAEFARGFDAMGTPPVLQIIEGRGFASPVVLNATIGGSGMVSTMASGRDVVVRFLGGDAHLRLLSLDYTVRWKCGGAPIPPPPPCTLEVLNGAEGRIDYQFEKGFPGGAKRCWQFPCEGELHLVWEDVFISSSKFTPTSSLIVSDGETVKRSYSYTGPFPHYLGSGDYAETVQISSSAMLKFENLYAFERYPGFALRWGCGATRPSPPEKYLPDNTLTRTFVENGINCGRVQAMPASGTNLSRWGYRDGKDCFVVPSCPNPNTSLGLRISNMEITMAQLEIWTVQNGSFTLASSIRTDVSDHRYWSSLLGNENDVVLIHHAFPGVQQNVNYGFTAFWECIAPEEPRETYLPECSVIDASVHPASLFSYGAVQSVTLSEPSSSLTHCHILRCTGATHINVTILATDLGQYSDKLEVLSVSTFEAPEVLWKGSEINTAQYISISEDLAVIRYHTHPRRRGGRFYTSAYAFGWVCGPGAVLPATSEPSPQPSIESPPSPTPLQNEAAGVQIWCRINSDCARYGNTNASCTSNGRCLCGEDDVEADVSPGACVPAEDAVYPEMLRFVWKVSCERYDTSLEGEILELSAKVIGGAPKGVEVLRCDAGVVVVEVFVESAWSAWAVVVELRSEAVKLLRQGSDSYQRLIAALGEPSQVYLPWLQNLQCNIAYSTEVEVNSTSCTATACEPGFFVEGSICVPDVTAKPTTSVPEAEKEDSSSTLSAGTIAGIVVGVVAAVLLLGVLLVVCLCKGGKEGEKQKQEEQISEPSCNA